MGEVSTIGEILELAITREVQAAEFYMGLAGRVDNPLLQSVFEGLANEELEHRSRLELEVMKEGMVAKTVGRLGDVEAVGYMPEVEIRPEMDYRDILGTAIAKERGAFQFYVHLAGIMLGEEVHDVLLQLAEEEARHLVRFETEYNNLTAKEK